MNYQDDSKRTDLLDYDGVRQRMIDQRNPEILHALMGCVTEVGEMTDQLKRHLIYGAPLDKVNLLEEAGDLQWYVALLLRTLDSTFDEIHQKNIDKLRARFPHKFTEEGALKRDLAAERAVLEGR